MAKWANSYKKEREKAASRSGGGIRFLQLKPVVKNGVPVAEDAKIARFRFISDADDAENAWVHSLTRMSRLGKRYNEDVYCWYMNENKDCKHCEDNDFPKRKLYFWVYLYDILHLVQDSEKTWKRIEYLEDNFYLEPVNDIRLFVTGVGRSNATEEKFVQARKRFKTLCDRNYEWTRNGIGLETTYDLVPGMDKSDEPVEVTEARKNLPSTLSDIINGMKDKVEKATNEKDDGNIEEDNQSIEDELEDIFGS